MMKRYVLLWVLVCLLSPLGYAQSIFSPNNNNGASNQGCSIQNKLTFYGETIGPGEEVIAFGPYRTRCPNRYHVGRLTNLGNTMLDLKLQRNINGRWLAVATGDVRYQGDKQASEYRWIVTNLGETNGTWKLDIEVPM